MRTIICCIALLLTHLCDGQCPSDRSQLEIAASYGVATSSQLGSAESNKTETYYSGARFVTLRYFPFNRLAIGASIGATEERGQYTDRLNPSVISSTYNQHVTVVVLEFYYIYFFRKYVEVYTLLGAGPAFTTTETTTYLAPNTTGATTSASEDRFKIQYSPVGLRIGGRLGAFVELGVGYKGIVNGGVSFKFGHSCWWRG